MVYVEPPGSWLDEMACPEMLVNWFLATYLLFLTVFSKANALVQKQRVSLVEAHKQGCPWKTRQCDREFHHVDLVLSTHPERSIDLPHSFAISSCYSERSQGGCHLIARTIKGNDNQASSCMWDIIAFLSQAHSLSIRPKRR